MKIFMVGATGRTGKWILEAALAKGHHVTTLVRPPVERLASRLPRHEVVGGDLMLTDLAKEIVDHDVIFSALDSASVAAGTRRLIAAATEAKVSRFIGLAGGGILQLDSGRLRRDRPGYPELFVRTSAEHLAAWQALTNSSFSWTLFCTPDLRDAAATGQAKTLEDYMPEGGRSVAAGDVADLFVRAAETGAFLNKRVGVTI